MSGRLQTLQTAPVGEFEGRREAASLHRGPVAHTEQVPPQEILAFSIPEFCRRHGISRAHFYNLSKSGHAPTVMRVGRRTLISAEAAAEWRRRMEAPAHDAIPPSM